MGPSAAKYEVISLPKAPRGKTDLAYVSNSSQRQPAFGGPTKLINRLGDRFAYKVTIKGRAVQVAPLVAKLNAGRSDKVRMPVNQPVDYADVPGAVTVHTAVSGGHSLNLAGLPVGHSLKSGQMVSVMAVNGVSYLHQIVDDATADGSGRVALTVTPMVRSQLNVGDQVNVNAPIIEGYLAGSVTEWTADFLNLIEVGFQIVEAE